MLERGFLPREAGGLSLARDRERLRHGPPAHSERAARRCGEDSKQPLNDDVFGEAIGGGLLNAEGEAWRWQRRLTAPLFRVEDVLAYVPAFAEACGPVLERWREAPPGTGQAINRDMTRATLQALQDSVLGASLGEEDRRDIEQAGAAFLGYSVWKIALTSVGLPPWIPHPGSRVMTRAGRTMRDIAMRVLVNARKSADSRPTCARRQRGSAIC